MNPYVKYLGFLAVIPILLLLIIPDYIGESDSAKGSGVGANQFGSTTKSKVCGDQLCSETGGRTYINQTAEQISVTSEEDKIICMSLGEQVPCENLDSIIVQKETINEMEKTIEDLESELSEMKQLIEENMTQYSSILKLSRVNVPATIPLHLGYYNGDPVYYIITDSSDAAHAEMISENQGWQVNYAPILANASKLINSKTYIFTNGVPGDGVHGFQGEVFTNTPQHEQYSALTSHIHVTWNNGAIPRILDTEREIKNADDQNQITITKLGIVLNMPQIVWPGGQIPVKVDKTLTDDTPFVGGQVLDIDLHERTVTFIAHRGWGPDGRTTYCIVSDATPVGPAGVLGVINVPSNANLVESSATANFFHFLNGIKGSGPMGFQSGIFSSASGYFDYSPMWWVYMIDWNKSSDATVLTDKNDIDHYQQQEKINIKVAKPMNADHIINCPVIDPFQ
jgi:hypothetical protein